MFTNQELVAKLNLTTTDFGKIWTVYDFQVFFQLYRFFMFTNHECFTAPRPEVIQICDNFLCFSYMIPEIKLVCDDSKAEQQKHWSD
jgi:hypothetical protein